MCWARDSHGNSFSNPKSRTHIAGLGPVAVIFCDSLNLISGLPTVREQSETKDCTAGR